MAWQQITVRLDADLIAETEVVLRLAGARAVAVSDAGDHPLFEPEPGTMPLWPRARLTALFDAALDSGRVLKLLPAAIDAAAVEISVLSEQDWIDGWRESVTPVVIGDRLRIVPPDEPQTDASLPAIILGMGLAFGTGRHPTTRLCLEWLTTRSWTGCTVLDFGCGSGVLALAALRQGASFAWATDTDEQALVAIAENAQRNRMEDRLWIGRPESLPQGHVDLLMANILAGTLCRLAGTFATRQKPGGRLVLSGVLESQADEVLDAYAPYYEEFETTHCDGWIMQTAVRTHRAAPSPART